MALRKGRKKVALSEVKPTALARRTRRFTMNKFIALLALAMATLANTVHAVGTGMPMMKGLKSPTELAALVDRSLASDPTGRKLLDPAQCKRNGSCATAHDYFQGIQRAHPSAKLGNIAELSRYLRSLVKQPAPKGEWYMSRMLVRGEKYTYDHAAWKRAFFKGEFVWDDPNTGEHILAGDCSNIIAPRPIKPQPIEQCYSAQYTVERGDEVRFAFLTRKRLPRSACWELCDGTDCAAPPSPCDTCEWIGPKSVIPAGYEPFHTGRYIAQSKQQTLRFPREAASEYIALCDFREGLGESDSWIIQPSAWGVGVTTVVVPYGGQPWPAWGQVDPSKWRKP